MSEKKGLGWHFLVVAIVVVVVIVVLTSLQRNMGPPFPEAQMTSSATNQKTSITLPYNRSGEVGEMLHYSFSLPYTSGQSALYKLVPDDCIILFEINKTPVSLPSEAEAHKCDYQNGFSIDLQPYLRTGNNAVHIIVRNDGGGPTGLAFAPVTP